MGELFGTKRPAITKHLSNIFKQRELLESRVSSIMEHTAEDGKNYKTKFYSLDAIISVGYRINSVQATRFRIWATQILREHLLKGYTLNKARLYEKGLTELEESMKLLQRTLVREELVTDIGKDALSIIMGYAKSWRLLLAYDEDKLKLPKAAKGEHKELSYKDALKIINSLKTNLFEKSEASVLFGNERDHGLDSILGNIEQSFGGEYLYKSIEEKAAHLLYFVIKDHPFTDGNKRIGCLMFLVYLNLQGIEIGINENGMVALALLVAESDPKQKQLMISLISNLLSD